MLPAIFAPSDWCTGLIGSLSAFCWARHHQHRAVQPPKIFHTELIMDGLVRLLDWCKRERESLQMQREMLLSGKFRIFKDEGSGQVDACSEISARIGANITELDSLLDECKMRPSDAQRS
jgi:hypothetical protein